MKKCLGWVIIFLWLGSLLISGSRPARLVTNKDFDDLHDAIRRDDLAAFERLIGGDASYVHARNTTRWAPLHVAAYYGAVKVAEYLLAKNAGLDVENNAKEQPLHLACLKSHLQIVEMILNADAHDNSTMKAVVDGEQADGKTPLFYALRPVSSNDSRQIVSVLIEHGADIFHQDTFGMQPVHEALVWKNLPGLQMLVQKGGHVVEEAKCCKKAAKTLSHLAAEYNFAEFVKTDLFNASALDGYHRTPLCWAAVNGSLEFAKKILATDDNKVKVIQEKCPYNSGKNIGAPLHLAAYRQQERYVKLLLENGADAASQDSTGATALHALALGGASNDSASSKIVEKLLAKNEFLVESVDFEGRTPFLICAASSATDYARLLKSKWGANPSAVDNNGFNAFHLARDPAFVELLFNMSDLVVTINDYCKNSSYYKDGSMTPYQVAVKEGKSLEFLRSLLSHQAKVDAITETGQNVMHLAVEYDNVDALGYFVRQVANLSTRPDNEGLNALHLAVKRGKLAAAKVLVEAFKKPDFLNRPVGRRLDTALHIAARLNEVDMAKLLIDNGANISAINADRQTALHEAVLRQNVELVRFFARQSANNYGNMVLAKNNFNRTAIHLSTRSNRFDLEMANVMLASLSKEYISGILDVEDKFAETPLHRAVSHESADLVKLLLVKYNATNCMKPNKNGMSPLALAQQLGYGHIAEVMEGTRRCTPFIAKCHPSTTIRLFGGDHPTSGFVKLLYQGQWGSICAESLKQQVAEIICRSLCLSLSHTTYFPEYYSNGAEEEDLYEDYMENYLAIKKCSGMEAKVEDCTHGGWTASHTCQLGGKVSIACL